mgnify:CR=1 FL=1
MKNYVKLFIYIYYDLPINFHNNQPFPTLDKEFICDIFKVITKRKCNSGGYRDDNMPEQLKTLTTFYKEHYSKTIIDGETLYYDKLSYILAYEAIDMITNINNNIQEHFIDHLNKYVNIIFDVKKQRDEITKTNKDKELRKQLHKTLYEDIKKRFLEIKNELNLSSNIEKDLNSLEKELNKKISEDYLVSRGEYLTAKLMSEYLGYYFLDSAKSIFVDFGGEGSSRGNESKRVFLFP